MATSFFLFYSSCRSPELHSFPTRRSSDLPLHYLVPWDRTDLADHSVDMILSQAVLQHVIDLPKTYRSEEHTSELQSHSDLVCRLLLEKKKSPTRPTRCCTPTWGAGRASGP